MSKKTYVTLTGTKYYHGNSFLKVGMKLKLIKEPDNQYDSEAIRVELPGLGKIGYLANSPNTVMEDGDSSIIWLCQRRAGVTVLHQAL